MQGKTLVLSLGGCLVHSDFKFGKGVQILKRPGLDQFIERLSELYEIVIYTDDDYSLMMSAMPIIDKRGAINFYFGRESMVFSKGKYYKDLSYLNREMRKIVVLDKTPDKVAKHKKNVIVLPEFNGSESDKELI
jgi:import inner membrane translocase subunit TIM50